MIKILINSHPIHQVEKFRRIHWKFSRDSLGAPRDAQEEAALSALLYPPPLLSP